MSALPNYLDPEIYAAFVEMRQALKGIPFTPRAQLLIIRKCMKMHGEGFDPNKALEKSTIQGWRDLYPQDRYPKEEQKDPALAKLDLDKRTTAPPTPEMRARLAQLTGRVMEAAK